MDQVHIAVRIADVDVNEDDPSRVYHTTLTAPSQGYDEPRKWLAHVLAWVTESQ
jgi:hypothetical protein